MNVGLELDKAAPLLSGLKKPMVVAKVDADKYTSLASKHDIEGKILLNHLMSPRKQSYRWCYGMAMRNIIWSSVQKASMKQMWGSKHEDSWKVIEKEDL
ncbi:uncharacterized protein [Primulina huaijiensis]|uniref:uncharacterized protein isoform X2 n=1 Tax=Primulina huaijiensis TaxID=1492673 RepID=UPI003CC76FFD